MKIKSEFIWGIIIGCLLTILGAFIQTKLYENYDKRKSIHELELMASKLINTRLFLASSVVTSSKSSVFDERWNSYISNGVNPWNINRSLIQLIFTEFHRNNVEDFKNLDDKFRKLNSILIEIRKHQNTKSTTGQNELKELEKNAAYIVSEIGNLGTKIEIEILRLKY